MVGLQQRCSLSKDGRTRRIKYGVVLQALLVVPFLLSLGNWQLERREQKTALLTQWQEAGSYQGLEQPGLQRFDRVQLRGQLDPQRWLLLDNRVRQGVVGYEVIGLLKSTSGAALLVSLGWVAAGADRDQLPDVSIPEGERVLRGRLDQPQAGFQLAADNWGARWPKRIQQLTLARVEALIDTPLQPWLLRLDTELLSGEPNPWKPVIMPPTRHLGYAVQWFGLALAWLMLTGWLLITLQRSGGSEGETDE